MIYYPVPLHKQEAFADLKSSDADFPVTDRLSEQVMSLPMHTELTTEQLEKITGAVLDFFKIHA